MTRLVNESCAACDRNAIAVEADEQAELLLQLPGWQVVGRDGVPQLEKVYSFKDFNGALDFANAVGELAEGANHHPAILVEWGKTTVRWWTHTIGGLHRNDFIMAAKTDYLHGK
ncbi:4a-hydroxytetrahydrobiopterin dehydratase [Pseudomaricurvus sp. HS19]|uniref:4a-hydroxytetrahydrobiopterin dehydratase n=1 Tax=Pseudomaricurvus sp. HS19 TaxID=2692626 RepID=UPI0013688382|nr:4a-hydroxytetrahydrobiopterin dehydratase [Pseudomaricurvus sp. HS19]MYM64737.1 4a-hydroxytetrahydrobiopterin dehydratase [Pseudomaricurvus sp. HS19]